MAEMKFKIGDKVRITGSYEDGTDHLEGEIGTVVEARADDIRVTVDGSRFDWWIWNHNAEVITETPKYKVGDRVIIDETNIEEIAPLKGKNVEGTITKISDSPYTTHPYLVVSDYNPHGLYCSVKCLASEFKKNTDKIVITHDGKTTTATLVHEDGSKDSATANCAPEDKFDFNTGAKLALERLVNKVTTVEVEGFKVGDRVNVEGMNGTIICITMGDMFGVQFDDEKYEGHRCLGVKLKAGSPSNKCNCWWVKPCNVKHGEAPKPEGIGVWTGRAVCINDDCDKSFTVGKIYKIENGKLIDNLGSRRPLTSDRITKPEDLTATTGYWSNWPYKFIPVVE